jgi:multiple sugar transport system substrate-binding protein
MRTTRSTRTTRRAVAVGLAVTTAVILVGCSGQSPTPQKTAKDTGPVTIQFLGEEAPTTFKPAIDAFEKAYPNITVTYNEIPFASFDNTISARMSSKDSTLDVYMVDEPRVPTYGASKDLVPYTGSTATLSKTFDKNGIQAVTWNKKTWALPLWSSSQLLYYNTDLLKKAGITPPSDQPSSRLTWEQLIDSATQAQKAGAQWGFSFQQVDRYYQLQTLPESLGGGPGLKGKDLLTPALTNAGWLKAMDWYSSTFKSGVSPRGLAVGDIPPLFTSGKLAYMVGTPVYVSSFAATSGLNWGVAPMPAFAGGKAYTPTDGWGLGVSPYSTHQAAAWDFVKYLTMNKTGSAATIKGLPFPSSNKTTEADYLKMLPTLAGGHAPNISSLLSYELKNTAIHRPRTVGYVAFEQVMNQAFADIRNGADPKKRLTQAETQLTAAFRGVPQG